MVSAYEGRLARPPLGTHPRLAGVLSQQPASILRPRSSEFRRKIVPVFLFNPLGRCLFHHLLELAQFSYVRCALTLPEPLLTNSLPYISVF